MPPSRAPRGEEGGRIDRPRGHGREGRSDSGGRRHRRVRCHPPLLLPCWHRCLIRPISEKDESANTLNSCRRRDDNNNGHHRTRHPAQLRHPPPPTAADLAARTMVAPLSSSSLSSLSSRLSTRYSSMNNFGGGGRERNGNVAIERTPSANAGRGDRGRADAPSLLTRRTFRRRWATEVRDQQ
jgi:hypothetical protein